jgi:hypothetical protein
MNNFNVIFKLIHAETSNLPNFSFFSFGKKTNMQSCIQIFRSCVFFIIKTWSKHGGVGNSKQGWRTLRSAKKTRDPLYQTFRISFSVGSLSFA